MPNARASYYLKHMYINIYVNDTSERTSSHSAFDMLRGQKNDFGRNNKLSSRIETHEQRYKVKRER